MSKRTRQTSNRQRTAPSREETGSAVSTVSTPEPVAPIAKSSGPTHSSADDLMHLLPDFTAFAGFGVGAEEVVRFPYNPVRDVACEICGVPYGEVSVGGAPEFVRSHEMHLMDNDARGFIPRKQAHSDRQAEHITWEGFESIRTDRLHRQLEAEKNGEPDPSLPCSCPACVAIRTSDGAAQCDAWNAWAEAHMKDKPFLQIMFAYGTDTNAGDADDDAELVAA